MQSRQLSRSFFIPLVVFIRILEHHKRIVQELLANRCFNPDWNYLYTLV